MTISIRHIRNLINSKYHVKELPQYKDFDDKKKYYNCINIDSIADFRKELGQFFHNPKHVLVFRGINNASFRPYSTVQRQWIWYGYDRYFESIENYIKYQVKRVRKNPYLIKYLVGDTDYNILAMIQHYGGNSTLLDFSYELKSALFFAFDRMLPVTKNGGLNNYVSLYVLNCTHAILKGPSDVYNNAGGRLQTILNESGLNPSQINAESVLKEFEQIPYEKEYDGKVVHGGHDSQIAINLPFFNFKTSSEISNSNLNAQNGCFIQASSTEIPLDELFINKHKYIETPLISCYNIHKNLRDNIINNYDIPNNHNLIYPPSPEKNEIEKQIKALDKKIFWKWLKNGCKKF